MRLGGKKLADYDGERNRFYEASGFVAESRADFDPKQAPKGWDYEKQGKPDILFWRYAGEEAAQAAKPTDVESLWKSNYEVAEEWRDTEIRKAEEENANKTVAEEKQPVNEHMVDKNGIMNITEGKGAQGVNDPLVETIKLKGKQYSDEYVQKLQKTHKKFKEHGFEITEHALNCVLGRINQGKIADIEAVLDVLQTGKKYRDTIEGGVIIFKNKIAIAFSEDGVIKTVIGNAVIKPSWEEIK